MEDWKPYGISSGTKFLYLCRTAFNLPLVTDIISKQKINFLVRYSASENLLCQVTASNAEREIRALRLK